MKIIKTFEDGSALAELTPNEAYLIQRAVTAPIKRLVRRMAPQLIALEQQVKNVREFNDKFIETFYTAKPKRRKK